MIPSLTCTFSRHSRSSVVSAFFRGRFISFPSTDALRWYVFCADGYRILGEPPTDAIAPAAPVARQLLPRAVARSRRIPRTRLTRADLLTYLVFVVGYIAVF